MMRALGLILAGWAARGPAVPVSALIVATLITAGIQPVHAAGPEGEDVPVNQSLTVIATAFRARKPDGLTPLLPPESKIYVALESFEGSAGYYGRDQVYFILQKAFSDLRTVRFDIQLQRGSTTSSPGASGQVAHCVATWIFSRREGPDVQTRLHFLLSARNGKWSLIQIREAR
ncbi:MAG: hypothetical protein ACREAA_09070 [Candidatus Polarisedimenticolia bacterium]